MKKTSWLGVAALAAGFVVHGTELPAGYTALDYIQATSAGKQWILTDMTPACTDTVEAKVKFTNVQNTQALFCSRGTSTMTASFTVFLLSGAIRMDRNSTQFTTTLKPGTTDANEFVFNYQDYSAAMNGGTPQTKTGGTDYAPGSKLTLFASHTAGQGLSDSTGMGNYGTFQLYSFVLKGADGAVKLNLLPAKNAEGAIGLYDTVNAGFYVSMSESAFITKSDEEAKWTDEDDDKRVLTVPEFVTYALTADDVTTLVSSGRNLVIRGKGTVKGAVALTDFTKDVIIEGGVFSMLVQNCLGSNAGSVTIKKGAALSVDAKVSNMMVLKKVYFEGTGPDGLGAIRAMADMWNAFRNSSWDGPHNEFYMTGDATIYQYARVDYISFIDTCGHDLTINGNSWVYFGTSYFTNSSATASHVINNTTKMYPAQTSANPLRGSADNVLSIASSGQYYTKWDEPNGWTIDFQNGTYLNADQWVADGANEALSTCRLSGPVQFSGATRVTIATNRVATLAGSVSGSGTITVDGGWLNLASTNVSYTGRLAVAAKSVHEDSWRAGLALRTATDLPFADISFSDADLLLAETYASAVPPLVFTGSGTDTLKGGNLTGARVAGAGLLVTNGAVVEISSPISVTGVTEIVNGTLRIPTDSPLVGNAGLMGYEDRPTNMVWWFSKPTAAEIARDYTNFYPHGTDLLTAQFNATEIRTYRLHGYIWNRSTTNETWSFWANFNDRAFVWLDDEELFKNVASYDNADKRRKTVSDITPGAHEIILNFTANKNSAGPQWWSTADGYCGIAIDKSGRGMTNNVTSYYRPLIDSGDGSLLTVDDSTTVSDACWVPSFTNLVFGANGILDCGGHDLAVGTLEGFGTVTNASTLTVAEKLVLKVADAAKAPLAVDGTLAFAEDAVVDFDSYAAPSAEMQEALKQGIVVARATAIEGVPRLSAALQSSAYRIRKQGNELVLKSRIGFCLIFK